MGIKRQPETGEHFISAPKVRSSRQRYEKTPLVPPRRGIIAAILSLFQREKHHFSASAIASRIDQGMLIAKRVIRQNANCGPESALFTGISDQLRQHYIEAYRRADNELDGIDDNLKQEEAWLNEARPSEILSELETKLEDKRVRLHIDLLPAAEELVETRVSLERFRDKNNLSEEENWGKKLDMAVFGQIGVLLIIEFMANAIFQSDTQQTGLIGGVLVALLTSLATIILGVMFGVSAQRMRLSGTSRIWSGFGLLALTFLLTFVFVSSLSLIRLAGEGGDLHPLETARLQLIADPFAGVRAMLDLPAFAYTLCISALIAAVARKYLQYFGSYPGLRKWMLDFVHADEEFDEIFGDEMGDMKDISEEHTERLEKAPSFIVHCKVPIKTLVTDHENVVEQHLHDVEDVRGAGRLLSAFLREHVDEPSNTMALPLPEHEAIASEHVDKLAKRLQKFTDRANELCEREDVSEETVENARDRLNDLVEAKLDEFAQEREDILDQALKKYKEDRDWLREVVQSTSRSRLATA